MHRPICDRGSKRSLDEVLEQVKFVASERLMLNRDQLTIKSVAIDEGIVIEGGATIEGCWSWAATITFS